MPAVDSFVGELLNPSPYKEALAEVERLRVERDALRADAERYRWLRGDAPAHSERWSRWNLQRWDGRCWHSLERAALDVAIDAAIDAALAMGK